MELVLASGLVVDVHRSGDHPVRLRRLGRDASPRCKLVVRLVWLVVFCIVPIIGPLVYLAFRPPGTTARQRAGSEAASTAQELATLADLHDRGKLTDHEYQQAKSKHVGVDLSGIGTTSAREERANPLV